MEYFACTYWLAFIWHKGAIVVSPTVHSSLLPLLRGFLHSPLKVAPHSYANKLQEGKFLIKNFQQYPLVRVREGTVQVCFRIRWKYVLGGKKKSRVVGVVGVVALQQVLVWADVDISVAHFYIWIISIVCASRREAQYHGVSTQLRNCLSTHLLGERLKNWHNLNEN